MRSCTDRSGTEWEVFEVAPAVGGRSAARMPESFRAGWLCFQSATDRRRLAPVPAGWREWDDRTLLAALEHGEPSRRRTGRSMPAQARVDLTRRSDAPRERGL